MSERENALENELRSRNLRMLAVLAGLFLLPLAVAFWMYYGTDWRPARRVNHGELIIPARPLPATHLQPAVMPDTVPAELFHRKWSLVYVGDGQCDDVCRKALYVMRQTRLSLNNEMSRVDRVFLATVQCCARDYLAHEHPGLLVLDATGPSASSLLGVFPVTEREQSLFIVDPLGNLMMSYDVRQNPKGLLQDLKKLLSLSHIG
jgi:cytochrome oxidase Cu insertion factor (SCO1/SenC/PrrC family)